MCAWRRYRTIYKNKIRIEYCFKKTDMVKFNYLFALHINLQYKLSRR